jgi:hypothetical protein
MNPGTFLSSDHANAAKDNNHGINLTARREKNERIVKETKVLLIKIRNCIDDKNPLNGLTSEGKHSLP